MHPLFFRGQPRRAFTRAARAALALTVSAFSFAAVPETIQLAFANRTEGPLAATPVYVTVTALDVDGRFERMDGAGRFHPCRLSDNTIPKAGSTWCAYSFPLARNGPIPMAPGRGIKGGRLYLSIGAPLYLRVDPATGGLVQPDLANPQDPNGGTTFDWMEFALDDTGFHGNTTCVDQFGLPLTLEVVDGSGASAGPVGMVGRRSDLLEAYRAAMPEPFRSLLHPQGLRITAPGHAAPGPIQSWMDAYIGEMWEQYRTEPLVLTPAEGTFRGTVEPGGMLVFTRNGGSARYLIRTRPTTLEVFQCSGPLAEGSPMEKVIGAQLAALLNRRLLQRPLAWKEADLYYRGGSANSYADFWHEHSLGGKAYGFPYDDVNDQSTLINAADPRLIRVGFRID